MATYSFLDVQATIVGPGGSFSIGSSAGVAEEGITVTMREEKNSLAVGADGTPMNSLHADNSGVVTVRLLKTSPTNALLMALYNFQKSSSANWGQNVIVISDTVRGDVISCQVCAFAKVPDLTYGKEAGLNEWGFHAGAVHDLLGAGTPDINI